MIDQADIENRFTYHAPDEPARQKHANMRTRCWELADMLNETIPDGREKALAITHLEEVMFWGNAAIARNPATAVEYV